jgi:transglutaminase-like putative cysteine protease
MIRVIFLMNWSMQTAAPVPEPQYLRQRTDYFGNIAHVFMVQQPHDELAMTTVSMVETSLPATPAAASISPLETVARRLAAPKGPAELAANQFIFVRPLITVSPEAIAYGRQSFPPGKPRLIGADASYAWISLFLPDTGWVDLDPTNNLIAGESHITVAWGRDYGDVTPVKGGAMGGGVHSLSVTVDVAPQS